MNLKRASVSGSLETNCSLDSYPKFIVFFSIPNEFDDYSFHQSAIESELNLNREKLIEFVPPNGKETIFNYLIDLPNVDLPFEMQTSLVSVDVSQTVFWPVLIDFVGEYHQGEYWGQSSVD